MSQKVYEGLVSVIVSSWGNEITVYMWVANVINRGSYENSVIMWVITDRGMRGPF